MSDEYTPPTIRGLLLARTGDPAPGLRMGERTWTWGEVIDHSRVRAGWMQSLTPRDATRERPHVGVLLENVPEFVLLLGAAAFSDAVLVGLNPTRRGAQLARDIAHTDCDVIVTDPTLQGLLDDVDVDVDVIDVTSNEWAEQLRGHVAATLPEGPGDPEDPFVLVLTSGSTSAPKAVVCSSGKIGYQGSMVPYMVDLGPDDVTYVSMPLYHSNAIIAGWAPTVSVGATLTLGRRFSASGFLEDVRRYGATYANYVGTPLSYVLGQPERDDDPDLPLRVVFGNEGAPTDVARFGERFGCRVIDAYGSTEGGISIVRTPETPPTALGVPVGDVVVLDVETGQPCATAAFDAEGRLTNADQAVGEMVNRDGRGAFEGYWNNPEAEDDRLRDGHYHSGDLGYRDADGFLYFAGRTDDWLRVKGENVAVGPIQRTLGRHPDVRESAVLGVPDPVAGDRVLAVVVDAGGFDPSTLTDWLADQPDLARHWWPAYLRVVDEMPRTGTGKVARHRLRHQAWFGPGTHVLDDAAYRPMTDDDRAAIADAFGEAGRSHLLPLATEGRG